MNCVGYARVSTEEQNKENCSIPTQKNKIQEIAKEKGHALLETFVDDGYSGSSPTRPGLLEMMAFCRENKIDSIYVLDTDRFARDEALHFALKAELHKRGTIVESINQPMLDNSPEGKFLDSILAAVNALYPKITGRKTSISMLEKVKLGWWPGMARVGYLNTIDEKAPDGFEKRIMILDKEQSSKVEKSFKLFSTGKYNLEQLCDRMFEEGLRSKGSKRSRPDRKIVKSVMATMLRDVFYTGQIKYMGTIYPDAKHPPIIDMATFIKCNEILDQHNYYADRKRKHSFLLSGYIACGICGRKYTAENHGGKEKSYYHCPASIKSHSNKNQNVETTALELEVGNLFKGLNLSQRIIDRVVFHAKKYLSENHNHIDIAKENLLDQQQKLERRRNNFEVQLGDEIIDSETYLRQMAEIKPQLVEITGKLAKLAVKRDDNAEVFEQLMFLTKGIYKAYCNASPKRKRAYINLFFEKIVVQDKTIIEAVPTKLFHTTAKQDIVLGENASKVIKKLLWLPGSDSNGQHLR